MTKTLRRYVHILDWGRHYDGRAFRGDLLAAVIVTIMLIPQSLAYALLAGLPPEAGIYASIVPIMLYALFGTSRALAVGPVAVVSLLTASAIGEVAQQGTAGYAAAALTLAFLSGGFLLLLGLLRLGRLANFLSHPVIAGFITASGLLIAAAQIKHILGISAHGHTLPEILSALSAHLTEANAITMAIGLTATAFLFWVRGGLKPALIRAGLPPALADVATKAGPVAAIIVTTLLVWIAALDESGVRIVGSVPQSLPPFTLPDFAPALVRDLLVPALLISVIGFVESVSVAQTLAARKRQRIDPDQELIGLGAANLGAAFSGGFPVTGGFSRSVVNFDAGAETPAAGIFTALGLAIAAVTLTPLVYYLPNATLAATIIVAVLSLVDVSVLAKTWAYSKADFAAVAATIILTLGLGVEVGVASGVVISLLLHIYSTSQPHVAEVGLVPGTQHFRNVLRHSVETAPSVLSLRIDESLYFANARFLEDLIQTRVANGGSSANNDNGAAGSGIRHVILMCSAVNEIDFSALESLEAINRRLKDLGIRLHLSEVKGPVMDRLSQSHLLAEIGGEVYLSQFDAWQALRPRPDG